MRYTGYDKVYTMQLLRTRVNFCNELQIGFDSPLFKWVFLNLGYDATLFWFVARLARVRIEDSSRNRFASTAYFVKPDYVKREESKPIWNWLQKFTHVYCAACNSKMFQVNIHLDIWNKLDAEYLLRVNGHINCERWLRTNFSLWLGNK